MEKLAEKPREQRDNKIVNEYNRSDRVLILLRITRIQKGFAMSNRELLRLGIV